MATRTTTCAVFALIIATAGCAGHSPEARWGGRWPAGEDMARAAVSAARSPATWIPLVGAAVLTVGDLDEDLSDWGSDHAPLFGGDAEGTSDDLRSAAKGAWLITALVAPSDGLRDKDTGLVVGASTLVLEEQVTDGIKELSGRRRPDGSDDRSFSSGHAGTASAAATLARRNLNYVDLPGWLDGSLRVGLHGLALATGWARVEAEKHHVTDVLAGYAVGYFVAAFMHEAFMQPASAPLQVHFQPLPDGGALTVVVTGF